LYDRIPADADPLGPDNILGFTSGFLCGTRRPVHGPLDGHGQKSLTGGWGDSNCGGNFAPAIKRAGYDALFFTGISPRPVYLKITGAPTLVDATHLWGLDAVESEERLIAEAGVKNAKVVTIGPPAKKYSLISASSTTADASRRARVWARDGRQALKGVVLAGKTPVKSADAEKVKSLNQQFMKWFKKGSGLKKVVTSGLLSTVRRIQRKSPLAIAVAPNFFAPSCRSSAPLPATCWPRKTGIRRSRTERGRLQGLPDQNPRRQVEQPANRSSTAKRRSIIATPARWGAAVKSPSARGRKSHSRNMKHLAPSAHCC
jgi:aldehyde:ferredoxin oxidoreductase